MTPLNPTSITGLMATTILCISIHHSEMHGISRISQIVSLKMQNIHVMSNVFQFKVQMHYRFYAYTIMFSLPTVASEAMSGTERGRGMAVPIHPMVV